MVTWELTKRLMNCFNNSFINQNGEFIAHRKANEYFILSSCETELDIKCKVLEWFSRSAYKTCPFASDRKNKEFHKFMLSGINKFLETEFTVSDIDIIYTYLGNACHHSLTIEFIESGYDLSVLERGVQNAR
jgi:hypothetical protein